MSVTLNVNGASRSVPAEPDTPLLYVLRNDLALNGAKFGCGLAQCGSCTVLVDGRPVRSCVTAIGTLGNAKITTIEGLGEPGNLHPMQAAFLEHDGYQCGYCTSGQIMSATALLNEPIGRSEADVREAMSGNICRCGAYKNIVAAIQQVRQGT